MIRQLKMLDCNRTLNEKYLLIEISTDCGHAVHRPWSDVEYQVPAGRDPRLSQNLRVLFALPLDGNRHESALEG